MKAPAAGCVKAPSAGIVYAFGSGDASPGYLTPRDHCFFCVQFYFICSCCVVRLLMVTRPSNAHTFSLFWQVMGLRSSFFWFQVLSPLTSTTRCIWETCEILRLSGQNHPVAGNAVGWKHHGSSTHSSNDVLDIAVSPFSANFLCFYSFA